MKHELKTWPVYFDALWSGLKRFEVRKNDRGFKTGDRLVLREYDPERDGYSGRQIESKATYVMGGGRFGIDPEWCVISLKVISYRNVLV